MRHSLNKIKKWFGDQIGQIINIDQFDHHFNIIVGYKGSTTVDAAAFYCPYIPIISTSVINRSNTLIHGPTGQTFTLKEILETHERDQK